MGFFYPITITLCLFLTLALAKPTDQYTLNLKTGLCDPKFIKGPSIPPYSVSSFNQIDKSFLADKSVCRDAKTCISPDRLNNLISSSSIPRGIDSGYFLTESFQKKQDQVCSSFDPIQDLDNLKQIKNRLTNAAPVFPIETKLAYDIVLKTKQLVDSYVKESENALEIMEKCLELNLKYETITKNYAKKKELYLSDLKKQSHLPKGCQIIWSENSLGDLIQPNLKEMRQSLFLLQQIKNKTISEPDELETFARRLADNPESATKQNLSHQKGKIFNTFTVSDFWENTPTELTHLNAEELKSLPKYIEKHKLTSQKDAKSLKTKILKNYFSSISENPILVYFKSDKPDAKEILYAHHQNLEQVKKSKPAKIDDIDYLEFSSAFKNVLSEEPKELIGDYCVLAGHMLTSKKTHEETLPKFLTGLILGENYLAFSSAKTALSKAFALFFGARYSGTALSALNTQKAFTEYSNKKTLCKQLSSETNGICKVDSMEVNSNEYLINQASFLLFSLSFKKTATLIITPALMSKDSQ